MIDEQHSRVKPGFRLLLLFALLIGGSSASAGCNSNTGAQPAKPLAEQTGEASFYGADFQGKPTASGEPYDQRALTAAHPSYPLGTQARVTNLENNRTVEVRISDRGPAGEHRADGVVIDLSRAAAEQLDFISQGRAWVRVEVIAWGKEQAP